jgi:hypothetical protein
MEKPMQTLDPRGTELLLQLIPPHYPNQSVMLITDHSTDLHRALYEETARRDFFFDLRHIGEAPQTPDAPHPDFKMEPFDFSARQYNRQARLYDALFLAVSPDTLPDDPADALKKIYRIMKNAGSVVWLIPPAIHDAATLLERTYFTAINPIDLFNSHHVVTAKKLHGWGAYEVGF